MKKIKVIVILLLIATMVSFISPVIVNAENSKVYTSLSSVCTEIRKGILERRNEVNTTAVDYYFTVYYKTKSYNEKTIYDESAKSRFLLIHGLFRASRSHNPTHIRTLVVLKHHFLLMWVAPQALISHRKQACVEVRLLAL